MSSFIYTFFRGFYPPYIFFVVWGIAARIRAHRWRKFDELLLAGYLIFEFFAAFQVFMFYGRMATSARYMLVALPLYLPFAAEGLIDIWNILKRWRYLRMTALTALSVLAAIALFNLYSPIIKLNLLRGKRIRRRLTIEAAAWVKRDWRPRPNPEGIGRMKCNHYHSDRRPLVKSDKFGRVGYLCGGQVYPDYFFWWCIPPDYIITANKDERFSGYVPVGEVRAEGETAYIHNPIGESR